MIKQLKSYLMLTFAASIAAVSSVIGGLGFKLTSKRQKESQKTVDQVTEALLLVTETADYCVRVNEPKNGGAENLVKAFNQLVEYLGEREKKTEIAVTPQDVYNPVSVIDLVETAVRQAAESAFAKNLDLASFVAGNVPAKILGNKTHLKQVLSHLIDNAVKSTVAGYVAVSVEVINNTSQSRQVLEFSVVDTGVGYTPDQPRDLADQNEPTAPDGIESGLVQCKKLVAGMEGVLSVETVPDKGSRFYFQIPIDALTSPLKVIDYSRSSLQNVAVIMPGLASRQSLTSYLYVHGIKVTQIIPNENSNLDISGFDAVFVCKELCERLSGLIADNARPAIVILGASDDIAVGSDKLPDQSAKEKLSFPISCIELAEVLERVANRLPVVIEAKETTSPAERDVDLPILDQEVLADLEASGGGDGKLLNRVFELFTENGPSCFEEIEKVSQHDDEQALADAAHGLKSMCANIGAAKAAAACHALELAMRTEQEIDVGEAIVDISNSLQQTMVEIKQHQAA